VANKIASLPAEKNSIPGTAQMYIIPIKAHKVDIGIEVIVKIHRNNVVYDKAIP